MEGPLLSGYRSACAAFGGPHQQAQAGMHQQAAAVASCWAAPAACAAACRASYAAAGAAAAPQGDAGNAHAIDFCPTRTGRPPGGITMPSVW